MDIGLVEVKSCSIRQGPSVLMPPYNIIILQYYFIIILQAPHRAPKVLQLLHDNYPRYTGDDSSHFTGPGYQWVEKRHIKMPWGFVIETLNDSLQQHLFHISHIHIQVTQSHGITWVAHPFLHLPSTPNSLWREVINISIMDNNPKNIA